MSDKFKNLFIFEMANNHQGSVQHGLDIINAMGKITRNYSLNSAVKFQYRQLDTFIHPDYKDRSDVKHIPRFTSTRLSSEEFYSLIQATRKASMSAVVTPFDEESVKLCIEHDVDIIKVASCSVKDWPLLEAVANANKPVIVSTGGATINDIDRTVSYLTHRNVDFAILHCVSMYPTPDEALHLAFIERLKLRFPKLSVGYSGHEAPDNILVGQLAVAKGAEILERHIGIPTDTITLNKYSMNPHQVDKWVKGIIQARVILGHFDTPKIISEKERLDLMGLERGVFAKRDLTRGESITSEDVFFAMPRADKQLTSGEFGKYRTSWIASKNYKVNDSIYEEQSVSDTITIVRDVILDVKGMLNEAHINLGVDFSVELSHHRGMAEFRNVGATIINIVNRDYCKKIIVMLPNQKHPVHYHKNKEESFQLLWGDLQVRLGEQDVNMNQGDLLLVERSIPHSFVSTTGAIFEEISTTHIKDDSFYEDKDINSKDVIERKTLLEEW